MVDAQTQVSSVAHAIQLAVAPVFLLAGVGSLLAVLATRLARVIDRFHWLEKTVDTLTGADRAREVMVMIALSRRARLIHRAIILCTACELLVCLVVAALFVGALFVGAEFRLDLSTPIAVLFITAMASLISGLTCFLREIALATRFIEDLHQAAESDPAKG